VLIRILIKGFGFLFLTSSFPAIDNALEANPHLWGGIEEKLFNGFPELP